MQRASAVFGLLIFVLWLVVIAVGLSYVMVWATTRKRPQWWFLSFLSGKNSPPPRPAPSLVKLPPRRSSAPVPVASRVPPAAEAPHGFNVIPFDREAAERRRRRA